MRELLLLKFEAMSHNSQITLSYNHPNQAASLAIGMQAFSHEGVQLFSVQGITAGLCC